MQYVSAWVQFIKQVVAFAVGLGGFENHSGSGHQFYSDAADTGLIEILYVVVIHVVPDFVTDRRFTIQAGIPAQVVLAGGQRGQCGCTRACADVGIETIVTALILLGDVEAARLDDLNFVVTRI